MKQHNRIARWTCRFRIRRPLAQYVLACVSGILLASCAPSKTITDTGVLWMDPDVTINYASWPYEEFPILSRPDPRPDFDCNGNRIDDAFDIFGIVPRGPYDVGSNPDHLTAVDLDGDSDKELVVSNHGSGTLTILWQNSFRRFDRHSDIDLNTWPPEDIIPQPTCVAAGDIDGDDDKDLIVGFDNEPFDFIRVVRNQGDPDGDGEINFAREQILHRDRPIDAKPPLCVALADIDEDGDLDIVGTHHTGVGFAEQGEVALYINSGDGTFSETAYNAVRVENPRPLITADLSATNRPDVIGGATGLYEIYVLENGTGAATPFDAWSDDRLTLPGPANPVGMVADELDANPGLDLAVLKDDGRVYVMPNLDGSLIDRDEGSDLFGYSVGSGGLGIGAADVDNDGLTDLVVAAGADNAVAVLINFQNRAFSPAVSLPVSNEPAGIYVGNLDSDARPEIAVSHRGTNDVWVLHVRPEPISQDCNNNSRPDSCDIRDNPVLDGDRDGILDSCGGLLPSRGNPL